ncbi:N-carbamoylputrescine amidase [Rhodovibrio sodomensis]|uniref:N-carbamoylputrescine amidase n=1 Tax=Rhodovibrio sodomensis TaxID=1088 RepID=A0ABS1DL39_9PROT|nr:N-carbamoylputrescine amidase [Rhodovibrio sodomensis]MBK1670504.1 N-carbamoylputrescine amidase [Rhodovibrio sodomensis]
MREITVAATQMACSWDTHDNLDRAEALVRQAASDGANAILLQELFETPYFCKDQKAELFKLARPFEGHPVIARFAELARELGVVLPISFFERANNAHYNSLAMVDADGAILGVYRKSHIPDGPGYQEKFYFNPGDTGFMVFDTHFGRMGTAICWDQWFPEAARAMALQGAEVLFYPTAIGSEPQDPTLDSRGHWQRVMQGHAGANLMPLVASNRIGAEPGDSCTVTFYGRSFVADPTGALLAEAGEDRETAVAATFDLDALANQRAAWGLFRDRRPELYDPLLTLDGEL